MLMVFSSTFLFYKSSPYTWFCYHFDHMNYLLKKRLYQLASFYSCYSLFHPFQNFLFQRNRFMSAVEQHNPITKTHLNVLFGRFAVTPTKTGPLPWPWWCYRWRNRYIFKTHSWIPVSMHYAPSSLSKKVRFTFPKS